MNGKDNDRKRRTPWEVIREELLEPLARELRPMAAGMEGPDEGHTLEFSFQELSERTECPEFPNGLDFSSDPGSHRRFFYEKRIDIADEFILYFTSVYGFGLKFTSNPLLGLKWKEEYELELAHSMAGKTEALWAIAKGQVPQQLRQTCDWFLKRTQLRRAIVGRTQRENLAEYLKLKGGDDGEHDDISDTDVALPL